MDFGKFNLSSYLPAMPYAVRELVDKATSIVMNYTETEGKVVEATNDESWGPAGRLLQDLSQLSYSNEHYNELMGMLWKRCFTQDKRYWRRTYKSLLVLTYLIKNGSEKVLRSVREHLFDLRSLEDFTYHDEQGKDQGINIRHKAKELIEFVQDEDRVRDERKKAKVNRDKYVGMSNESSYSRYNDRWNDDRESKDFNERAKSKTVDDFTKVNDFDNEDYLSNKSNEKNQNLKSVKKNDSNKIQNNKTSTSVDNLFSIQTKTPVPTKEVQDTNLLGDDLDFIPYANAPQNDDFGQFQQAALPTIPIQPTVSPTASAVTFDPFGSLEPSTNLSHPTLFSLDQPQKIQQSVVNAPMFQQQTTIQPSMQTKSNNTWLLAEGKLDISLNNLIPHTRGNMQKTQLTLNQLTSPTSATNSNLPSLNTNTQAIFSSKK